jgi:membrane fusion protein (multidrug efflux system)
MFNKIIDEIKKIEFNKFKKHKYEFLGIIIIVLLILIYFKYESYFPSTDNAYVNANIIHIIPKVSGNITEIFVQNNDYVKKGQIILTIDNTDYLILLNKAKLESKMAQQVSQSALKQVLQAASNVKKAQANYKYNEQMRNRYRSLFQNKAGSLQSWQKFENDFKQAKQDLNQAKNALFQAKIEMNNAFEKIQLAQLELENTENMYNNTIITAPVSGYIGNLNLEVGQLVAQGQNLCSLIDDSHWWIDANYKETYINRIKINKPAKISLDMYKHKYRGYVESISYASTGSFSLLPPQNSSGNWVKVSQLFKVRVHIENDKNFPLRVGASSVVVVNSLAEKV